MASNFWHLSVQSNFAPVVAAFQWIRQVEVGKSAPVGMLLLVDRSIRIFDFLPRILLEWHESEWHKHPINQTIN